MLRNKLEDDMAKALLEDCAPDRKPFHIASLHSDLKGRCISMFEGKTGFRLRKVGTCFRSMISCPSPL